MNQENVIIQSCQPWNGKGYSRSVNEIQNVFEMERNLWSRRLAQIHCQCLRKSRRGFDGEIYAKWRGLMDEGRSLMPRTSQLDANRLASRCFFGLLKEILQTPTSAAERLKGLKLTLNFRL